MDSRTVAGPALLMALAVTCQIAVSSPAEAWTRPSRAVVQDGVADVWQWSDDLYDYVGPVEKPGADFTGMTARHGRRVVIASMRFVDLTEAGYKSYVAKIRTPRRSYLSYVHLQVGATEGMQGLERLTATGSRRLRCAGDAHHVDFAQDVAVIRVPRRCLDSPRWVRVATWTALTEGGEFIDNPHNDGPRAAGDLTRRLYRQ